MKENNSAFGPQNAEEERIFAEENFRIDVQMAIHNLMKDKGVKQKDLAERLGVSEARVSQLFSDEFNMTVRRLARVFHALGEYPSIGIAAGEPMQWQAVVTQEAPRVCALDVPALQVARGASGFSLWDKALFAPRLTNDEPKREPQSKEAPTLAA